MRRFRLCVLLLSWLGMVLTAGCAPHFGGDNYIRHIAFLASDDLGGRAIGTPGNDQAAEYIAWQFQQAGLKPGGDNGTYFQNFEIPMGVELLGRPMLSVAGAPALGLIGRDFMTFPFSAMEDFEGPLAFAGYGISNADAKYDDYEGFDATGKVLLLFRYEPHATDPKAKFGGQEPSHHSTFLNKVAMAKGHGAKAVLIVNPPFHHGKDDRLFAFNTVDHAARYSLPMMHVTREFAERFLRAAGADDLAKLQRDLDQGKPRSMDLKGLVARGDPGLVRRKIKARNVIGELPGLGPDADEYVVVGAHYDHVGRAVSRKPATTRPAGGDQTEIHNGADDNASGTAGVIELARAYGHRGARDRSMLFMAFTAEEIGLVGSAHYVEHPIVPLEKVAAMLNLDMIGRLRGNHLEVLGTNSATQFEKLAKYRGELLDFKIKATGDGFGGSDQSSFLGKQIPVMFFFTGMHDDYHMPSDDTEKINADGGARVVQLAYSVLESLAAAPGRPAVLAEGKKEKPKTRAPRRSTPVAPRGGLKVRLGVMPSYAVDDGPGLLVQGTAKGSTAERAGLVEGDRILKIGEKHIKDVFGLMEALKDYNPGDTTKILVLRGKKQVELNVRFDATPSEPERKAAQPEEAAEPEEEE